VEDDSTFDIETNLGTLKYPNKWKEKVLIEVTDEKVCFSKDGVQLFDLFFKDSDAIARTIAALRLSCFIHCKKLQQGICRRCEHHLNTSRR
jgi:hypothetical protein